MRGRCEDVTYTIANPRGEDQTVTKLVVSPSWSLTPHTEDDLHMAFVLHIKRFMVLMFPASALSMEVLSLSLKTSQTELG
jgi:hypothetical protein